MIFPEIYIYYKDVRIIFWTTLVGKNKEKNYSKKEINWF